MTNMALFLSWTNICNWFLCVVGITVSKSYRLLATLAQIIVYSICIGQLLLASVATLIITPQEHQRIRTFAIYQTFLTLKFVFWAMEIFTFSSIQPIWVKICGKNLIRYGDLTYIETFMDPIRMIQIINIFHQLPILSPTWLGIF